MQPNPANDDRPASFDAQLVAAMPMLRRRAWRYVDRSNDADDLVQLTMIQAMRLWESARTYPFHVWLCFQLRQAAYGIRRKERRAPTTSLTDDVMRMQELPANQDSIVELSQVRDALQGRAGEIVWRVAQGEELAEVGQTMGITKQRAHVLAKQERERLAKRLNTNRSMRIAA